MNQAGRVGARLHAVRSRSATAAPGWARASTPRWAQVVAGRLDETAHVAARRDRLVGRGPARPACQSADARRWLDVSIPSDASLPQDMTAGDRGSLARRLRGLARLPGAGGTRAQCQRDAVHGGAPVDRPDDAQSEGAERGARAASVAEDACTRFARVTAGLLPLHRVDVAIVLHCSRPHLALRFPSSRMAGPLDRPYKGAAGASSAVASRRKTWTREARLTCASHAECACLVDRRRPNGP